MKCSDERVGRQARTLTGHSGKVNSIAFSPDGDSVVSGADDMLVKIWDVKTGAEVSKLAGVVRSSARVSRVLCVRRALRRGWVGRCAR